MQRLGEPELVSGLRLTAPTRAVEAKTSRVVRVEYHLPYMVSYTCGSSAEMTYA